MDRVELGKAQEANPYCMDLARYYNTLITGSHLRFQVIINSIKDSTLTC